MKCFHYFKDKTKSKIKRSAPILKDETNLSISEDDVPLKDRVTKFSRSANAPRGIIKLYEEKGEKLRVFTYTELRQATKDFTWSKMIGEGGFGCVYNGSVKPVDGKADPIVVAVKKFNIDVFQDHKQWVAELQFLEIVDHPNLVKLIGYCAMDGAREIQRLLVYEFMPNKSLEDHLFRKSNKTLPWQRRLQIMLGAAQGLAYLHEELQDQFRIIFRDFKTTDILLDGDFNPKLSDFGLARERRTDGKRVFNPHSYVAPEYIETCHTTTKSDVWSFGIVLYEILTGRRAFDKNRPKEDKNLVDWLRRYPTDSKNFGIIIDPRLKGRYSVTAARKIAKLADSCLSKSPKDRTKMSQVVESLKQILEVTSKGRPSSKSFDQKVKGTKN